ncbi:MAG: hypothetical protein COB83_10725 [Gammaproteobacteria bacterium]|nr:MAG: hypothetical protein COB83_10725 [Gammaproteobacteria bacterium]
MKILVLGGCGQEGKTAVKDLLKQHDVTQVIIGDIDINSANNFKNELANDNISNNNVSTIQLDVMDKDSLLTALHNVDVVANFVGPFYRFGVPVLTAAIESKTHYVDICDDYDATESLLELNDKAKEAGICAIIGLGVSPGVTNIAAKMGADKLDQVDDIDIHWIVSVTDVDDLENSAAVDHALHILDGNVPQYLDGQWQNMPAMSESESSRFNVIGDTSVYYVGHPEPVTLPRYIKGVKNVRCKGGCPGADEVLHAFSALGLTSSTPLDIDGMKVSPRKVAMKLLGKMPMEESELPPPYSGFKITVSGIKNGEAASNVFYYGGRMSAWTATPTSIGVLMLARGEIEHRGVLAPEGCIEPERFFSEMAKRDLIAESIE